MPNMQFAWQLDPHTLEKIKKGFLIGSAGFVAGTLGILLSDKDVIAYLATHPILGVAVGSYVPVLLNSLNEWRKGQVQ